MDKLQCLAACGAMTASSAAEVMSRSDVIGLCLTSDEAVEQVAWGPEGLFSAEVKEHKVIADFSTGSPARGHLAGGPSRRPRRFMGRCAGYWRRERRGPRVAHRLRGRRGGCHHGAPSHA